MDLDQPIFKEQKKTEKLEKRIVSGNILEAKGLVYDGQNNLYMIKRVDDKIEELWKRIGGTGHYIYASDDEEIVSEYHKAKGLLSKVLI